ncbi:hypothetical protein FOZ62_024750 [Perkinsus olseni]|uniref:Uncharacterized protein n=1 Tax=Perkinsus olseni TaxID=32597 RepID=A0A7J6SD87_PEROL|nr:hypothetical protein FOZ62_024750 [Perkinsus olseni]
MTSTAEDDGPVAPDERGEYSKICGIIKQKTLASFESAMINDLIQDELIAAAVASKSSFEYDANAAEKNVEITDKRMRILLVMLHYLKQNPASFDAPSKNLFGRSELRRLERQIES